MRRGWFLGISLLLCLGTGLAPGSAWAQVKFGEQRLEYALADVLSAAVFDRVDTHWRGYASERRDELIGFVFLTDDLVDIPGYSGQTLNTLVGMDTTGTITGVRVVRHAEPIVLIGLPADAIPRFTSQYAGTSISGRVLISDEAEPGYVVVDGISGATVTAAAENATILEAARLVGRAEGIVRAADVRTRRPSTTFETLSWAQLEASGALGTITVTAAELGLSGSAPAVDLWFTVLDPRSVGRNLLGDRFFEIVEERLARDGGSALYVGGLGALSFKGPGFARGGIFDRFGLEQDGRLVVFRDVDYIGPPALEIVGAPSFRESGIFFTDDTFDPTAAFTFRLTVPYRIQDQRRYATFLADHQLADRFVEAEAPFWVSRWRSAWIAGPFTTALLGGIAVAFAFRQRILAYRKLLHYSTAVLAAVGLGLVLKAQPSTTQILTIFGAVRRLEFPVEIFLTEPLIFVLWISIIVTLVIWGRGFFCGWVCPYGALLEALIGVWGTVAPAKLRAHLDSWQPPRILPYLKIAIFVVIIAVSLVSLPLAEALDEVEPFKTFVLAFARPPAFVFYFVVLTLLSVARHRFFCRFLCPLGGALAIPSTKPPLLPLFRYDMCTRCTICARGCDPQAISFATGRVNYQECLQCWDCQATGTNEAVCPELIVAKKERRPVKVMVAGVALALLVGAGAANAETRRVAPGTLPAALATAEAGDVLVLEPGVHQGPVRIDTRTDPPPRVEPVLMRELGS